MGVPTKWSNWFAIVVGVERVVGVGKARREDVSTVRRTMSRWWCWEATNGHQPYSMVGIVLEEETMKEEEIWLKKRW